jgi:hypothetical protein
MGTSWEMLDTESVGGLASKEDRVCTEIEALPTSQHQKPDGRLQQCKTSFRVP